MRMMVLLELPNTDLSFMVVVTMFVALFVAATMYVHGRKQWAATFPATPTASSTPNIDHTIPSSSNRDAIDIDLASVFSGDDKGPRLLSDDSELGSARWKERETIAWTRKYLRNVLSTENTHLHDCSNSNWPSKLKLFGRDLDGRKRRAVARDILCTKLNRILSRHFMIQGYRAPPGVITRWIWTCRMMEDASMLETDWVDISNSNSNSIGNTSNVRNGGSNEKFHTCDAFVPRRFSGSDPGLLYSLCSSGLTYTQALEVEKDLQAECRAYDKDLVSEIQTGNVYRTSSGKFVKFSMEYEYKKKRAHLVYSLTCDYYDRMVESLRVLDQDPDSDPDRLENTRNTRNIQNIQNHLIFLLLARYETLGGDGYQAAIPDANMRRLETYLDVSLECFASPLNARLGMFCSAYYDTDMWFGSRGSFFSMAAEAIHQLDSESNSKSRKALSFEANPPFVEEIIMAMGWIMCLWLSKRTAPLSFAVICPAWMDSPGIERMIRSPFCTFHKPIAKSHGYKSGTSYKTKNVAGIPYAKSLFILLQNDSARDKWPWKEDMWPQGWGHRKQ